MNIDQFSCKIQVWKCGCKPFTGHIGLDIAQHGRLEFFIHFRMKSLIHILRPRGVAATIQNGENDLR